MGTVQYPSSFNDYGSFRSSHTKIMNILSASPQRLPLTSLGLWVTLSWAGSYILPHPVLAQDIAPSFSTAATPRLAQATAATMLWVDPKNGIDQANGGNSQAPLKTITYALQIAQPRTVIQLSGGVYSAATGEQFPLILRSGLTLQGNPQAKGQTIQIRGGGFFLSRTSAQQNVAILTAEGSTLNGVTVINSNPRGYGVWVESASAHIHNNTFTQNTHDGISVVGTGAPMIENNLFVQNGANGITIFGTSQPVIQNNQFESTGFGINIAGRSSPQVRQNVLRANKDGIVIQGFSQPILRGNTIEQSERDGVVAISQAQPNLGTSGDPGGNVFRSNRRFDLNNSTRTTLVAVGNQWPMNRLNGAVSLVDNTNRLPTATSPQWTRPAIPPVPPVPARPSSQNALPPIPVVIPPRSPNALPPLPSTKSTVKPAISRNTLPVPSLPPIGNGSKVNFTNVSPPPSPAIATLRYRVIVPADKLEIQAQVRQLIPDAFRTRSGKHVYMQAGAFGEREKAELLAQTLKNNGLKVKVSKYK